MGHLGGLPNSVVDMWTLGLLSLTLDGNPGFRRGYENRIEKVADRQRFKLQHHYFVIVWSWATYLTSLTPM